MDKSSGGPEAERHSELRRELAEVALQLLLDAGPEVLTSFLTPSRVIAAAAPRLNVSRDTVYRALKEEGRPPAEQLTRDVVELVVDPEWSEFAAAAMRSMEAYASALTEPEVGDLPVAVVESLRVIVEGCFEARGVPLARAITGIALTCSPRWTGQPPASSAAVDLGRELLARQASFVANIDASFSPLMASAMAHTRRRPRDGTSPEEIALLMHCLLDGAVLRLYEDPDLLTSRAVAEAMVRLGLAYSQPGAYTDPRAPAEPDARAEFDRIVKDSLTVWAVTDPAPTVASVASAAQVTTELVRSHFASMADLADSTLRVWVENYGPTTSTGDLTYLAGLLQRLAVVADELPAAVEALDDARPVLGAAVTDEIESEAKEIVRTVLSDEERAAQTTSKLLQLARGGMTNWPSIELAIEILAARISTQPE